MDWLAAYLYYAEPWEAFLTSAVKPFVESVLSAGWATQFFFIRYWEHGPHIRLRFRGEAAMLYGQLKPRLMDFFHAYFDRHPSQRMEPHEAQPAEHEKHWVPNHSIVFTTYEPEVERYGGSAGIVIAERQFEASSRTVLALLEASSTWDYDRALGAALQLDLSCAWALGLKRHEAAAFYSYLFQTWPVLTTPVPTASREEILERHRSIYRAFEENFLRQRAVLLAGHTMVWNALEAGEDFEEAWLNEWRSQMACVASELKKAQFDRRLVMPVSSKPDRHSPIATEQQALWPILASYVHMTNNRLGILNRDEAYVNYLIKRSLETLIDGDESSM